MRAAVVEFLRKRVAVEAASDWARIRRIPSGQRFPFLDYWARLDRPARERLLDAMAVTGAGCFGFPPGPEDVEEMERYREHAFPWSGDWRTYGVRLLRMSRPELVKQPEGLLARELPQEIKDKIMTVESAKAPELRKVARLMLGQLLGAKPESEGGGDWHYAGKLDGEEVVVEIDYGGWDQLRYGVRLPALEKRPHAPAGVTFENLLGCSMGGWNQIELHQEDNAMALLRELILATVTLVREIDEQVLRPKR